MDTIQLDNIGAIDGWAHDARALLDVPLENSLGISCMNPSSVSETDNRNAPPNAYPLFWWLSAVGSYSLNFSHDRARVYAQSRYHLDIDSSVVILTYVCICQGTVGVSQG